MKNVAKKELTFHATTLTAIRRSGDVWFTASDIARALQYSSDDAVSRIYRRNKNEFSNGMSQTVKLTVSGNYQKTVRIFTLRGAHLLAMFARTPIAKEFRRWVLDILECESRYTPSPIEQSLNLTCPECYSHASICHINKLHRAETVMHVKCTNRRCGIVHLFSLKHKQQITQPIKETVKRVIGAMSDDEKSLALGLLLRT